MTTKQDPIITVLVDGVSWGIFDTRGGSGVSRGNTKRRSGGGGPEKSYPGLPKYENGTVARVYERDRDHDKVRFLQTTRRAPVITVSEQQVDEDGNPWGRPTIYEGRFEGINPEDLDSESNDPRLYTIEYTTETIK